MAKAYEWRTHMNLLSGGYPGEEIGVIPDDTSWHSTTELSGSNTTQYWYRDSNNDDNNNSSRVVISITDVWRASISQQNYLTITVNTTVNSIVRDNIRGNPHAGGTAGRTMFFRQNASGPNLWYLANDNINTAHTIMGTPVVIAEHSFTLAPGENATRSTVWFRDNTPGHDSDPLPSYYADAFDIGVTFRNPLPKDHRVGATLKSDNEYDEAENIVWVNHNDKDAGCHVLSDVANMTWKEMRNSGDGSIQTEAPSILKAPNDNSWYNQRELGKYTRS